MLCVCKYIYIIRVYRQKKKNTQTRWLPKYLSDKLEKKNVWRSFSEKPYIYIDVNKWKK